MITDEQIRIALQVWFQDEGYEPSAHTMREMRATLEAALGGALVADGGGWSTYAMTLEHPVHGAFWVYPGRGPGHIGASRCYRPKDADLPVNEDVGQHATLEHAQAAVRARIAELDAQMAEPAQLAQVSP